jgi:negative regulator of sigma E activity
MAIELGSPRERIARPQIKRSPDHVKGFPTDEYAIRIEWGAIFALTGFSPQRLVRVPSYLTLAWIKDFVFPDAKETFSVFVNGVKKAAFQNDPTKY